jgi:hypothetical protein
MARTREHTAVERRASARRSILTPVVPHFNSEKEPPMSDITGTTSVGGGVSIKYDVNPSVPQVQVSLIFEGVTLGSATLNESEATASLGGTVAGTTCKATITANFSAENVTYSVTLDSPVSKKKTYSGTVVSWKS